MPLHPAKGVQVTQETQLRNHHYNSKWVQLGHKVNIQTQSFPYRSDLGNVMEMEIPPLWQKYV